MRPPADAENADRRSLRLRLRSGRLARLEGESSASRAAREPEELLAPLEHRPPVQEPVDAGEFPG